MPQEIREFWETSEERQDQRFYVAFCLLASAFSDHIVGADLRWQNKLNWSATVLYYSIVHAARLAVFIPYGDFPIGHSQLAQLFGSGSCSGRTWMQETILSMEPGAIQGSRWQDRQDFNRGQLLEFFIRQQSSLQPVHSLFQLLGQALEPARKLRNDSNYEGLLIAHEVDHQIVTQHFLDLTRSMYEFSNLVLQHLPAIFEMYVDSSARKDAWYSFLNWREGPEGLYYLRQSVAEKMQWDHDPLKVRLGGHPRPSKRTNRRSEPPAPEDAWRQLWGYLQPLRIANNERTESLAEEVRHHCAMRTFGMKNRLMEDFGHKTQELAALVVRVNPDQGPGARGYCS